MRQQSLADGHDDIVLHIASIKGVGVADHHTRKRPIPFR
jgi:hypothetical protein